MGGGADRRFAIARERRRDRGDERRIDQRLVALHVHHDVAVGPAQPRRHFERGQKLFSRLLFAEALEEYEAAYEAKAIPDFLFNIGQCHRNLGHYREAIFSFRRYLALVPDAEDRERVEELIAELEAEEKKANGRKTTPPPPPPPGGGGKPVYTRWWFWTGIAVVAGGTAAVVIATSGSGLPSTDLGNLDFPQ